MRLSLIGLTTVTTACHAFMVDTQVKPAIRENTRLTPDELGQLFHLDEALDRLRRRTDLTWPNPLTVQEMAQLWHLDDHPKAVNEAKRQPYTSTDRAQLWQLDNLSQDPRTLRRQPQADALPLRRMSSDDYSDLWNLPNQVPIETKLADHAPYTADERAQLWQVNKKNANKDNNKQDKFRMLSDQERAHLWHLNEDRAETEHAATRDPYTDQDRKMLWHLDQDGNMLRDETKRQIYTNQDRAHLWHLEDKESSAHDSTDNEAYTDEDRASLWHLQDNADEGDKQGGTNASYTAQDRKELWHL